VKPPEIYRRMKVRDGGSCLSQGRVYEWVERFQINDEILVMNNGEGDQLAWQLRQLNSRSSSESVTTDEALMMKLP
jgi:hypothetical protein